MAPSIMSERIRTTLEQLDAECPLEEVVDLCPDITWNQIFLAIDHLSRTGQVHVRLDANRTYWVQTHRPRGEESFLHSHPDSRTFEYELSAS
jgi:hypothetical protein